MMNLDRFLRHFSIVFVSLSLLSFGSAIQYIHAFPMPSPQREDPFSDHEETNNKKRIGMTEEQAAKEAIKFFDMLKLRSYERDLSDLEIAYELIKLGPPVVPTLISEMEKMDSHTLSVVIYSLGLIGDKRAIPPLYDLLPSIEDEEKPWGTVLKENICLALGMLGDPNSIPLIMQGPYAANRIYGLGETTNIAAISTFLGEKAVDVLIDVINRYKDDKKVYGAIGALGKVADERALPLLKKLLNHQDDTVKRLAIEAIAQIGNPSDSDLIKPFLDSKVDALRETAAESMYYLRDPSAIPKLVTLAIHDPVSLVRKKSLISLGIYHDNRAFQALLRGAHDSDVTVCVIALEWIGKSGKTIGADILRRKIKDKDVRISQTAIHALVELLKNEAEDDLLNILNREKRWIIQRQALRELSQIKSRKGVTFALSLLKRALKDKKDPYFKDIIMETLSYLSRFGHARTLKTIKKLRSNIDKTDILEIFDGSLNDLALIIKNGRDTSKWLATLQNGDPGDQAVAIEMLGEIADPSSVPTLITYFGRVDLEVGSLIPKALGKIKDAAALSFLQDLLTSQLYDKKEIYPARFHAAWALGEIGNPSSIKALKKVLYQYNGEPFTAIVAIAKIKGKEAIPDLYAIKKMLLREASRNRMAQYDNVNWLIRHLKNGWSISALDRDP